MNATTLALALAGALALLLALAWRRMQNLARQLADRDAVHQQTLDKLKENENRLRAIIESAPECVKLQARDGTVLEVNPAGLALIDAERPEDFVGKSIFSAVAPEHQDYYREQMRRVFGGESVVFKFRALTLKGRECWMETHAVPLRDAHGDIKAFLGMTRDLTQQKLAEEQSRRHQLELARVARLSSMGELATGIAHELNQPLAAIANFARGCVRRLRGGNANSTELIGSLEEVCTQAERAGEIIRHIRDFTRKAEPELQRTDINLLVRSVAHLAEIEVRQHGARLELDLAPRLPAVAVDGIMIEQVMCNLVRNAAEAMEEMATAAAVVTVRTRRHPDGGVEVSTADRGPGVTPAIADRIFDQFFTTKSEGVGIGLSISRSIVEAHGGTISVEARDGGGALFRVWLPEAGAEALAA
jgi:PAS domain S-box-containing protein